MSYTNDDGKQIPPQNVLVSGHVQVFFFLPDPRGRNLKFL